MDLIKTCTYFHLFHYIFFELKLFCFRNIDIGFTLKKLPYCFYFNLFYLQKYNIEKLLHRSVIIELYSKSSKSGIEFFEILI